ncbi:DUF2785 domain-containing protein [Bdellovibrio bacteriovorus]|uniref:DUF2785 domain-containing protein n=1 Tax=Bdellovibrio bacteriovorus TaxID=959 RepID=UPI0005714C70|nr:DUF2785 domain-containing protein [Bdellovibrio bacteriovorus]
MARRFHTSKMLIPLLLTLQSLNAYAITDANPQIANKHLMPNAVRVQITQRGMKYFDNRLSDILGNLGVKLDEGYFPAMSYTAEKPINMDDFMDANPEMVKMYQQVRGLLTQWLVGFSMNDHQPTIEIGESGYVAKFSRFGLVTDELLMEALGKRDGAILAIELEVKKLTISTQSVVAWDTQNEFLGKAGFEDVTLQAADEEMPLKIRLPFYLRMNAMGGLEFEALEISNNFDSIPLGLKYGRLIVPQFAVEVNGKKFYVNNAELEKLFQAQAPMILEKVRGSIGDFARTQLPAMLNQKAKEFLGGSLEQVQDMAAPGQEPTDTRPAFKWGLQLQNLNLKKSLNVDLTTYVEDPVNSRSAPVKSHASRGAPTFNAVAQENYDIGLSVDRALINRVLQLAFERRNFEQIKQSDGSVLKLVATPLIDYVKTPAGVAVKPTETFVKLRVSVEIQPGSMFLKKTIVVDFDIIAKLRQLSDKTGMQLLLHSIDTDSLYLDDKYISVAGKLFKGKVREGVKDELKKRSANWATTEESLPGGLPLPPQILGIKLDINRVMMDPNGHLIMYLDYAKTGANK